MALVLSDRIKETTTTTGTGTVTLLGAELGFEAFSDALSTADTTYYTIVDEVAGDWEVGIGIYTLSGTTLERNVVLSSSNSDAAVDLAAGTKFVFITYPAEKSVYLDASDAIDSPTLVTPALGTPASGVLTNTTGLPTAGLVDDAVTYAKMQNVVADERIWGRVSGADGVVEELTKAQVLTMLNVADGAQVNDDEPAVTVVDAATYDVLATDKILHVTRTATGACAITLMTDQAVDGRLITIKDAGGASTYNITVDTEGAETIDGAATLVISGDYDSASLYFDGTNWFIF
jgi:hypothetical protein